MRRWLFFIGTTLGFFFSVQAQREDRVLHRGIHSVKLYQPGDQTTFPALRLGSPDVLELHFDDLAGGIKNYYYTLQLCNADWQPSLLTTFEYLRGFQNTRITTYRTSSIAETRYTHYQATIPDRNMMPTRSGNYLLKVFLNADTSQLAFTKRLVVIDNKASVAATIQQPFNSRLFRTGQKLQIAVQTDGRTQAFSPTDLKVVVLQNNNWRTALHLDRPTISRGNYNEYSDEAVTALPAGKEFRWIDLRSFRLKSDRMVDIRTVNDTTHIDVKPDPSRTEQAYVYYRDLNGMYTIETLESVNPLWQGDYAWVHFRYFPPGNKAIAGRDVYLFGEFTRFGADTSGLMHFNEERGAYEKSLLLKQGYYNYNYATFPAGEKGFPDFSATEGNFWGTENSYIILVYFRPFGARADELIGYTLLNSAFQRNGY
ncbi:MAG TPA: DUF5103 domain-containing protein [Chitinophagaceae bacterium]|jgi:hypothetical protein|nr:DUF5103 domain-containing protein [Chitinophagaceae bacterium]